MTDHGTVFCRKRRNKTTDNLRQRQQFRRITKETANVKDSERPSDSRFPLTNNSANASTNNATANTARASSRSTPPARPSTFRLVLKWTSATLACTAALAAGTVLGLINQNSFGANVIRNFGTKNGIIGIL